MLDKIALKKITDASPLWFIAFWAAIFFANFIPLPLQPATIIGYLWKTETALAALILLTLAFAYKSSKENNFSLRFNRKEFNLIVLPLSLFVVWSGVSYFWADAPRNALHHTLLWASYAVFFVTLRQALKQPRVLDASLKFTGAVMLVLSLTCFVEYLNNPGDAISFFTFRYYKYAEIFAALLPVFLAQTLKLKNRAALVCGAAALAAWLVVAVSLSRAVFLGAIVGVGFFFALVFVKKRALYLKKSVLLLVLLALSVAATQVSFSSEKEDTTLKRLAGGAHSQYTFQTRLLNWSIALEMFERNPATGVGADNYITAYGAARKNLAVENTENPLLETDENIVAERAHNEFLQILSELGAIGFSIFAVLLAGIGWFFVAVMRKDASLLSIGAFAGIAAFLVSSLASSYSFRVPANGACFFFLLAIAIQSAKLKAGSANLLAQSVNFKARTVAFPAAAICVLLMIFSALRGASLTYLQMTATADKAQAEEHFRKSLALDGEDPMINYYYALHLADAGKYDESASHLRFAVERGIATSVAYFQLYTIQMSAARDGDAEKTLAESLEIFPRSVFLRTAYAAHLQRKGESARALAELKKAESVNAEQAEGWRVAFAEGMKNLNERAQTSGEFVKVMDLQPNAAIYALLDFQRQHAPNLVRR